MSILTIRHTTTYRYANPVRFGEHRLMFRPRDSHDLRLLSTALDITPLANTRWYHDVFGNSITIASFTAPGRELSLVSTITLEHFPTSLPEFVIEAYARTYPFTYSAEDIPDLGRTAERHYPDPEHRVDAWARRFVARGGDTDTHVMLGAMTQAIQASFTYHRRAQEGTQTPVETLAHGAGSCRDFALLMMEAARSLGLAARFVTGYLHDPTRQAVGGGETHAWVQIYLPGAGWVEFDPTNGIVGGSNLIRVAVARDPSQAVPVSRLRRRLRHVPGLDRLAQLELHAVVGRRPDQREPELEVRREPGALEREAGAPEAGQHRGEVRLEKMWQQEAIVQRRAPARDQRPHEELLHETHAGVGRHLEAAQLDQAEPPARRVGRVELVDAELGPVRVANAVSSS